MKHIIAGETPGSYHMQPCLDGVPVENAVACLTGDDGYVDVLMPGCAQAVTSRVGPFMGEGWTYRMQLAGVQWTTLPTVVRLCGVVTIKGENP